jgi:microcystin-dependent protein
MALAQEAEPGDPFHECRLAHERLRVSEARLINRAEILTARTDAAAEAAEAAAAEAPAAEASAAVEATVAAEAAATAGTAAKAAADAPAEDAEELPVGPSHGAWQRLLADRGGGKAAALDLVGMLGHKSESYRRAGLPAHGHAADGRASWERGEGL